MRKRYNRSIFGTIERWNKKVYFMYTNIYDTLIKTGIEKRRKGYSYLWVHKTMEEKGVFYVR